MIFKKIALILCILCAVIICSCDELEYTFVNNSSYSIQITLSEPYKNDTKDSVKMSSSFDVSSKSKRSVYVQKNDVDFTWTTYDPRNNSNVYCETNGSKATFKNQ